MKQGQPPVSGPSSVSISMAQFLTIASAVRQPVPGMTTFWEWASTNPLIRHWGGEDITNTAQRLEYMDKILVPYWSAVPAAQQMAYVKMSIPALEGLSNI